jgi:hypothetical protein
MKFKDYLNEREGQFETGSKRGMTTKNKGHVHDYFIERMTGDGGTGIAKDGHSHKINAMVVLKVNGHDHNLK